MYKLLIVDDEYIIRKGIVSFVNFSELNIDVVLEASDGITALEIFKQELPDLILADINMPKLNGLEFAAACKSIKPEVKICIVTGYDYFDYAVTALKLGVDDYILKPASKKDISEVLAKLINKISDEKYVQEVKSIVNGLVNRPNLEDDSGYKAKIQKEFEHITKGKIHQGY